MAFAFETLVVYQKSVDFADEVCSLTEQFPRGYGFLVDQLNRASLSVAAKTAEGNGRFTKPDRKHFFGIARGSVQEFVPLLELAKRRCASSTSTATRPHKPGNGCPARRGETLTSEWHSRRLPLATGVHRGSLPQSNRS